MEYISIKIRLELKKEFRWLTMNVTIKDIAQITGVSYSTVSKALNDSPLVKEATKKKIIEVANKMGYKPNFAAQRLVSKQTKVIGLIWPTIERVVLSTLVSKISDEIRKTTYSMILSIEPIEASIDTFKKFQVDGMILFEEHADITVDAGPISLLSYGVSNQNTPQHPIVDANHGQAMHEAVKYLHQLGHTKIAYIGDLSPTDPMQVAKYTGFKHAMSEHGLSVDRHNVMNTTGLDWYDGYTATTQLLKTPFRPTAIIGGSYEISGGIIRSVKEMNINIPNDMSIMSYDNIPQMAQLEVPLTCIGVPVDQLAKEIVKRTIHMIEQKETQSIIRKMVPTLYERQSCAPVHK